LALFQDFPCHGLASGGIERRDDRCRIYRLDVGGKYQSMALSFMGAPIRPDHRAELHLAIRKTGHFVGYGVVSLAFLYGWLRTLERISE